MKLTFMKITPEYTTDSLLDARSGDQMSYFLQYKISMAYRYRPKYTLLTLKSPYHMQTRQYNVT